MRISLNRGTLGGGLPLEEFVAIAAGAGFPAADVDLQYAVEYDVDALSDLYGRHEIEMGGWGLPFNFRDDKAASEGLQKLEKYAAIAQALNLDTCSTYILPSSTRPFIENWNFHVSRIKPIARKLADQGLRFGLEFVAPHHLRGADPHEFIFTPGLMLELADAIGPNVGLLVDCFHCHTAGVTWDDLAKIPARKIVQAHINDAPSIPVCEVRDFERLLPGEGVIDLKGYMKALKTAGYDGPVGLEVFSEALNKLSAADAAKKAWTATARAVGAG